MIHRIVICQGPGSEEDSHTHEKMYYFIREGPLHRCHLCGQVFKLVRLKDEYSELNEYYSVFFAQIQPFEINEEDYEMGMWKNFHDRPNMHHQTTADSNYYFHVNPDQADHMMVDPAYKLEIMEQAHETYLAYNLAQREVKTQQESMYKRFRKPLGKDIYENWWKIELAIRKFDRWFNRIERYESRYYLDPENHDRRENRMLERKRERWLNTYTYFFGTLTEEE